MLDRAKFDSICDSMENGLTLRQACIVHKVARSTFLDATKKDQQLSDQYARASISKIRVNLEEAEEELFQPPLMTPDGRVDTGDIQLRKLRWEARQWAISKMLPKEYGNKTEVEHSGSLKITEVVEFGDRE